MQLEDLKIRFPELLPDNAYASFMPAGWLPLFAQLCSDIDDAAARHSIRRSDKAYPRIAQFKEKFSEMRVYVDCANKALLEEIWQLTNEAAMNSRQICSECGGKGVMRLEAYVRNFCDACEKEFQRSRGGH